MSFSSAAARLGELLEEIPRIYPLGSSKGTKGGQLPSLPVGINKKESHKMIERIKLGSETSKKNHNSVKP